MPDNGRILGMTDNDPPYEVAFDGGAREIDDLRVAGAGAVLWGHSQTTGQREILGVSRVSLPQEQHAQVAEAWGLRLALGLLLDTGARIRIARVLGDNLAVVRYGAGHGRLHRPAMQSLLEQPLARAALAGWGLEWVAVRRRYNQPADEEATRALRLARELARRGVVRPYIQTDLSPGQQ